MTHKPDTKKKLDLTWGVDVRGDMALFIARRHLLGDRGPMGMFDDSTKGYLRYANGNGPVFFRLIDSVDGEQQSTHGWVDTKTGEVVQWG